MSDELQELIQDLDTSSDTAAQKTIHKIIQLGPAAIPSLLRAAKDKTAPRIRKWSLQALGAIGDSRAGSLLVQALKEDRMTVRLHALKGLGRMKFKKASKAVAELLDDVSGGIRVNALYTLSELGDKSVAPKILKLLDDPQWYIRQTAAALCGKFKITKAKKKLEALAEKDDRKAVRDAAKKALGQI